MGAPIYQPKFPASVDDATDMSGSWRADRNDRAKIDAQILALQAQVLVLIAGGGGGGGSGDATSIQGVDVDATPPIATGQVLPFDAGTGKYGPPRKLSLDEVTAAFTPTISLASGGAGPFKLGATWTPKVTGSPLANGAGVTSWILKDSDGNAVTQTGAGPYDAPSGSTSYTKSAPTTVSLHATEIQSGVTKDSNTLSGSFADEVWTGVGTAGATGLNGTTGALAGATGTLAATVSVSGKVAFSPSPSNQKVYYVGAAGLTFKDVNGDSVPMTSTTITVTNSNAIPTSRTLYESVNLLSTVATPITPS
jgi:hypothetical protein